MNIYEYLSYQNVIRDIVLERKKENPKANFQNMAKSIRVQKAYLSQVIKGVRHLSQDQLFLACRYLKLDDYETIYMELLLEYARCGLADRKDELFRKIKAYRQTHSPNCSSSQAISQQTSNEYYKDPLNQIVHACLRINEFRDSPLLLEKALYLPTEKISKTLRNLEKMGIIEVQPLGRINLNKKLIPPPNDDSVIKAWRESLSTLAMNRMNDLAKNDTFNFSFVFSADQESLSQIQILFDEFITKASRLASSKEPKEVYQINFDLFSWTQLDH